MKKELIVLIVIIILMVFSSIVTGICNYKDQKRKCSYRYDCYGKVIKDKKVRFRGYITGKTHEDNRDIVYLESSTYKIHLALDEDAIIKNPANPEDATFDGLKVGDEIEATPEEETNLLYPSYITCSQINVITGNEHLNNMQEK